MLVSNTAGRIVLGAVVCIASSGCYQWEPVKVSSLPDLDRRVVGERESPDRIGFRTTRIERPDGTLTDLKPGFDLEITREDGQTLDFAHPVSIKKDGDKFLIAGANRARTAIPMARIRKAQVSQEDTASTVLLITGLSVVGAGLAIGFAAAAPSGK